MSARDVSGDDLRARLAAEIGVVKWRDLRAHAVRDGLFVVAQDLVLAEVALAVAENATAKVQRWLEAGQLTRPSRELCEHWDDDLERPFRSVVVQPFALVQEIEPKN